MSSRIADIPVPPKCREMIRQGAAVAISTSGGKKRMGMFCLRHLVGLLPSIMRSRHFPLWIIQNN